MKTRNLLCLSAALALAACAAPPVAKLDRPFPSQIALLPMNNMSLDMQGPVVVRSLLETYLAAAGIDVLDTQVVDAKLAGLGISDGGQLRAVEPRKLRESLMVDGLLYGELTEFKDQNIGVYHNRTVEARLWLVDAKTGDKLWEATKRKAGSKAGLDKKAAMTNLATGYGQKMQENIEGNPLYEESEDVARQLVRDLNRLRTGNR